MAVPPASPLGDTILLHPGSGGLMKCWPRARFADLAGRLLDAGQRVRFVLGEAEAERFDAAASAELGVSAAPVETLRTLDELTATLRACRAYVGNDAGPTHLAAQLGLPTLALFGPSDPDRFRPLGPGARHLAPPEPTAMHWLGVDRVEASVRELLDAC